MASVTAGMAVSAIQPKTSSNIGLSLLIAFATQGTAVLAIQPKTFWKTGFNLLIAPSIEPTPPIALSIDYNMSATHITTHVRIIVSALLIPPLATSALDRKSVV